MMPNRVPRLLIVDDDPRILDFYREALDLARTEEELEANQEIDEMFSLLEEEDDEQEEDKPNRYHAVTATQGLEALRLFTEMEMAGTPFDLVLVDMRMPPGIDGLETALELRKKAPELPIIFFTAYSDYRDEHLEEKVGGRYRLLRKPMAHEDLIHEVEMLLPAELSSL